MSIVRSQSWALAVALSVVGGPSMAFAQARLPCPEMRPAASAAEQAVCWWERQLAASESQRCSADAPGGAGLTCAEAAFAWCARAALDEPQVATACFRAAIAVGELEAARELVEYVRETDPVTAQCRALFTDGARTRVVSGGASATVTLDGRALGAAPADVRLAPPWWDHRIEVRFPRGETRQLGPSDIRPALGAATCSLTDLVVVPPAVPAGLEPTTPRRRPRPDPGGSTPATRTRGPRSSRDSDAPSLLGGVATLAAGGLLAGGGALLLVVAHERASALEQPAPGSVWTGALQSDLDSVNPLSVAGALALGVGVGAATAGVIWLVASRGAPPRRAAPPALRLSVGPSGLLVGGAL